MIYSTKQILRVQKEENKHKRYPQFLGNAFHGIFFQNINPELANNLHDLETKPFVIQAFRLKKKDDKYLYYELVINSLTQELSSYLWESKTFLDCNQYHVKSFDLKLEVIESLSKSTNIEMLYLQNFKSEKLNEQINLEFTSPCSFKSKNRYHTLPDTRLILQSLMHKFDHYSNKLNFYAPEYLDYLAERLIISKFDIQSQRFKVDKTLIAGFTGKITLSLHKLNAEAKKIISLLIDFGEYSGLGIKASMGMGAYKKISNEKW